jgi:hypothetical protein
MELKAPRAPPRDNDELEGRRRPRGHAASGPGKKPRLFFDLFYDQPVDVSLFLFFSQDLELPDHRRRRL